MELCLHCTHTHGQCNAKLTSTLLSPNFTVSGSQQGAEPPPPPSVDRRYEMEPTVHGMVQDRLLYPKIDTTPVLSALSTPAQPSTGNLTQCNTPAEGNKASTLERKKQT